MNNQENPNEELVMICKTRDEVHESLITQALKDEEVEFVVQNFDDSAFDGLFQGDHGHSQILVLKHDADKAQNIVKEYDS